MQSLRAKYRRATRAAGIDFRDEATGGLRVTNAAREVGDRVIGFEGGGVTTYVGRFTHRLFTPGACGDPGAKD